jgi:hypothetical protein
MTTDTKIELKLEALGSRLNLFTCTACGRRAGDDGILCHEPGEVVICVRCLDDVDNRLRQRAAYFDERAAHLRRLVGRLIAPSVADYNRLSEHLWAGVGQR